MTLRSEPSDILLVDDHELMRRGLRQTIETESDLRVCAEASNTASALAAVERKLPALVIIDLTLGGEDGLDLLKALKTRWPKLPVLVVSVRAETLYAERVLRANGNGYLMKSAPADQVVAAIRRALAGEIFVSTDMNARLLWKIAGGRRQDDGNVLGSLSDRELHVFQLIGTGMACREIAAVLKISQRTAETHRENIKNKLGLDSALALTRFAVEWVRSSGN